MILSVMVSAILTAVGLGNLLDEVWIKTINSGHSSAAINPSNVDKYTSLSSYQIFPAENRFIKFHIKACGNAFVLLSAANNLKSSDFYEICIGGGSNKKVFIRVRRNGSIHREKHSFDARGLLSCSEHRTFIVEWEVSGRITLTAETGVVIYWTDTSPIPIEDVGVMTGYGSDGMWIIEHSSLFTGYYCGVTGAYGVMTLLFTSVDLSMNDCAIECALSEACLGINFHQKTNECQLVSGGQPVVKSIAHDWKFYTKCLREKTMCLVCIL